MIERCATCGQSLGTHVQEELFGTPKLCIQCHTNARIKMILHCLPQSGEMTWDFFSEWEQQFLSSVREQFEKKHTLSEKQYQVLERLWNKYDKF